MTLKRSSLFNLYSSPLDILKLAKDTKFHVKESVKSLMSYNETLEEMIAKLDDISDKMCVVTDSTECIRRLHPDSKWRKAADEAFNLTCSLMNELNSDRNLAEKVNGVESIGTSSEFDAVIESFKRDFEIFKYLSDQERTQVKRLQESVDLAEVEFENLQSIGSLEKMIKLRFELAKALGYKNPLEICLRDKQLNSNDLVMSFINKQWDEIYKCDDSEKRFIYTNLKSVIDVLVRLSRELFNIRIEVSSDHDFGGDLTFNFQVYDEENKFIGTILFDLASRQFKDPHPTHYTIKCRKQDTTGFFLISIGIKDYERISWNQSQSLFHEFGHALHSVLSKTRYQVLSGTRGPVDLAEIPSSLFELIHDSSDVQKELNRSGKYEEISGERIRKEEAFQVQIAAFDQLLHVTEPKKDNWTRDLAHEIEGRFGVKKEKDWHCSLTHLSTYGGTYFSYLYSKSVARLIKEKCEMNLFKREFLEKGGTARLDFIKFE